MRNGIMVGGCALVDVIKSVDAYPAEGELANIGEISYSTGGALCNVLLGLHRLAPELQLEAVGVIGEDELGERVYQALRSEGVADLAHIRREGVGSFTDVFSNERTRQRTFFHERGANRLLDIDDFPLEASNAKLLYVGYALLLDSLDAADAEYGTRLARLFAKAQSMGYITCLDVVSEQGGRMCEIVTHALKHTDILVCNELEAGGIAGVALRAEDGALDHVGIRTALAKLCAVGVSKWSIIHAPEAAYGMNSHGEIIFQQSAAMPQSAIVGTVGAGDAFCSGVLLTAHNGGTLAEALEAGAAAACSSLTAVDATSGMKNIETALKNFRNMKKRGM